MIYHAGMLRLSVLLVALLVAAIGLPRPLFAAGGPLDALSTIQQAVDKADSDLFAQAADLDSLLQTSSDALMQSLKQQADQGALGSSQIAVVLALSSAMGGDSAQASFIRQLLLSEVRGFVISGINGGYFAGQPNGSIKPSRASLASLLEKMPEGRREIVPGKVLSRKDGKATVSATFVDPGAGSLPLELALQEENGHWRVKQVLNAAALFELAARRGKRQ
jgi:ABC-type transporter MlaC component